MTSALPDPYILILTGFGLLTALVVWLPLALRKLPLSLPIVCIALGAVLFSLPGPVGPKLRFWPSRRTFWERGIRY